MKFEQIITSMSQTEYRLCCEVTGKLKEIECDPAYPEQPTRFAPSLEDVTFSNCELILVISDGIEVMHAKFDSLATAPDYLDQSSINNYEEDAKRELLEYLLTKETCYE